MAVRLHPMALFHALLVADLPPRERHRRARDEIMEDLQRRLPPFLDPRRRPPLFTFQQAARLDGYEAAAKQQGWGLFNPTRPRAASEWAVTRLTDKVAHDAAAALERALTALGEHGTVELLIVPADPANRNLMVRAHGLSVCAAGAGCVVVEIWPSDGNLGRLAASLARAAAHQACAARRSTTVSLGAVLDVEARAVELADHLGLLTEVPLWRRLFSPPDDHAAALDAVAGYAGRAHYDQLDTNIYGHLDRGAATRVPSLAALLDPTAEALEYTREAIATERDTTDPVRIAACLYGDDAVALWGHRGGGYGPFAGLAACRAAAS